MIQSGEISLSYVYSGLFVTENTWIHPKRTETTYEIICVTEGQVFLRQEGMEYELNKGDVMLLPPYTEHCGSRESNGKTSFYWIHFTTAHFSALQLENTIIRRFTNLSLFRQLLHIANTPDYPTYGVDCALLALLGELSYFDRQNQMAEWKVVRDAAEWIRIHSTQRLTVKEVSRKYGYHEEHFSRMFRKIFSIGMKEYICRERIKAACDLLCNTSYSVKQIAGMLDFGDENQFIHFFQYHQSQSPAKYRNSLSNIHMNQK